MIRTLYSIFSTNYSYVWLNHGCCNISLCSEHGLSLSYSLNVYDEPSFFQLLSYQKKNASRNFYPCVVGHNDSGPNLKTLQYPRKWAQLPREYGWWCLEHSLVGAIPRTKGALVTEFCIKGIKQTFSLW